LESFVGREVEKVPYAVFGAGNSEWRQTFHRIPKLIDRELEEHGAERLVPPGLTDVAEKDPFSDLESWEEKVLWPTLHAKYSISGTDGSSDDQMGLVVDVSVPRSLTLRQNVREAVVTATRILTAPGKPRKQHIEIKLPTETSYEAGDYLVVLPMNPRETVGRVFRRFKLSWDAMLTITGDNTTLLPKGLLMSAFDILSSYVELSLPATRRNLLVLAAYATYGEVRSKLESIAVGLRFEAEITNERLSVLDVLEEYPSVELPIGTFLGMLSPMRTRQ
jgi:cytochrome P450/NADPH-cytochrome P450 reductase